MIKAIKTAARCRLAVFTAAGALVLSAAFALGFSVGARSGSAPEPDVYLQAAQDFQDNPSRDVFAAQNATPSSTPTSPEPSTETAAADEYIIGESGGYIAIFVARGEALTLKEVTDMPVAVYAEEERERLREGIHAATKADMIRVLQNYDS
jgi:hypothetical protein